MGACGPAAAWPPVQLADAGFRQFHCHTYVDSAQNRVQPEVARFFRKPLGRHLEAGERGGVILPSSSPSLGLSSTSSALRPLATVRQ